MKWVRGFMWGPIGLSLHSLVPSDGGRDEEHQCVCLRLPDATLKMKKTPVVPEAVTWPRHPMNSNTGGKNIRINNDVCGGHRLTLRLHRQQHGGQDKPSSLFSYIHLFFFLSSARLQGISWPRPARLAVVIDNAANFSLPLLLHNTSGWNVAQLKTCTVFGV